MRKYLQELMATKTKVAINFNAAAASKLVSVTGTITDVLDDCLVLSDMYGNTSLVVLTSIACVDIKR